MKIRDSRWPGHASCLVLASLLAACGGGGETTPRAVLAGASNVAAEPGETLAPPTLASSSNIAAEPSTQGVTPFIGFVQLRGTSVAGLSTVRYVIATKPGTASKPVDVTYRIEALARRGYLPSSGGAVVLPVFGLYANHANNVSVELRFTDGSSKTIPLQIATAAYVDPNHVYDTPVVLTRRTAGTSLGFDFFAMKGRLGTPVVVDSDGEMRWVGLGTNNSFSSAFQDNAFIVGSANSTKIDRLEFDGTVSSTSIASNAYTYFHHNIDHGKQGLLIEPNAIDASGVENVETIAAEIASDGTLIHAWDFAALLGDYMRSQGDDPSTFIRPGVDWFHMNATTYDPRDDTVLVSSRENFVIKVDYRTGAIVWIFGDPTKYWYSFPSLRAKALTLEPGGLYPVGQHALEIASDGSLRLFNNGFASLNQPAGSPKGENRSYSAVSTYTFDVATRTARETSRFENGQTILSDICSNAYEASGGSLLINYAAAQSRKMARVVGVDASRNVVFDFQYNSPTPCAASWNAVVVPFDAMRFD